MPAHVRRDRENSTGSRREEADGFSGMSVKRSVSLKRRAVFSHECRNRNRTVLYAVYS